ncbi:MAG: hypothetical protein GTN81_17530 [Proteobacteria bacterium]|nr:hypothetical protein [Pseudomonadota bacterium]
MAEGTTVEKVVGKPAVKQFIRFPWTIYRNDPLWVPPLIKEQMFMFSPRYPFFEHGEIELFLARKGQERAGRVAAILDRRYIDFSGDKAVFFGFFESINDPDVARSLIDTVRDWGKARGMKTVRGPFNPSTNDECGLLAEGFDKSPVLMMPYNPSYYIDLMNECGLEKCKDLYAYVIEVSMLPEKLERFASRIWKRLPDLTIRPIRLRKMKEELQIIRDIYNNAWVDNWGFVPLTAAEIDFLATRLKPLVIEDLVLIAEINGEGVGFVASFPDYNQVLKRLNGKIGLTGALKFLYYSKKIKDLRTMLLGVKYGYQKRGIEGLLYLESFQRGLKKGFQQSELSWILEDNMLMRRGIEMLGGRIYKTYRLYEGPVS